MLLFFSLSGQWRTALLVGASYFFYMCWRVEYAVLMLASTLVDYYAGRMMEGIPDRRGRRPYLILSLVLNLGLLFTFKYYGFFRQSLLAIADLCPWGGSLRDVPSLNLLLPIGISFYTFQSLGYTVDVYRGKTPVERSLLQFALYVSFFPQLVAGPIERSSNLLPQFRRWSRFDAARVTSGLAQILWGLFKKVVIADRLAIVVDTVYRTPGDFQQIHFAIATVFFGYQIYCDFSGYSDIAIGSARIFGVDLMSNFNRPYSATSVSDFWRRWHISLSTWFRDYVYLPLGGSRVSSLRWGFNIMVVFLVSGLWHGANWTFVMWGGVHGLYMVAGRLMGRGGERLHRTMGSTRKLPSLTMARRVATFTLVMATWVFFRADSIADAMLILRRLVCGWPELLLRAAVSPATVKAWCWRMGVGAADVGTGFILIVILEVLSAWMPRGDATDLVAGRNRVLRWAVYLGLALAVLNGGVAREVPFIYFQF